jgi:aryl-alcohol dehydrogenase-like predicted oxidoreductase
MILGDSLAGERRESLEILTKVFGATGPGGPNDSGLSRKHIHESINASLTRLQTDYIDLYQAHRHDFSTPLEETMEAFADVRAGEHRDHLERHASGQHHRGSRVPQRVQPDRGRHPARS